MSESGGGGGGGGADPQTPGDKAKQDALYEDREPKKIIRIITVTAYMCSVSFVGVVLSAYYIFLWHPPNPRLMHQQVAHHDAQRAEPHVDYMHLPADFTPVRAVDPNVFDLLKQGSLGPETVKQRRDVVKNVNAILSANFEKVKFTETSSSTAEVAKSDDGVDTGTTSATTKAPDDSSAASDNFSSVSPEDGERSSSETSEDPTLTSTQTPPLRRTKSPGKKPHQTPFALKHLEVPIKLEPTRRRLIRFSTTTTRSDTSNVPDSTRGTLSDAAAAAASATASTPDSSEVFDVAAVQPVAKSLYKMLTSPSSLRDADYSSSTDLPQIFPAVPRANNDDNDDYRDATIAPPAMDDLLDD